MMDFTIWPRTNQEQTLAWEGISRIAREEGLSLVSKSLHAIFSGGLTAAWKVEGRLLGTGCGIEQNDQPTTYDNGITPLSPRVG